MEVTDTLKQLADVAAPYGWHYVAYHAVKIPAVFAIDRIISKYMKDSPKKARWHNRLVWIGIFPLPGDLYYAVHDMKDDELGRHRGRKF